MCESIQDVCKVKFNSLYEEIDEMKMYYDKRFDKVDNMFEKYLNDIQVIKEAIVGINQFSENTAKVLERLEEKTELQQQQINQITNDITKIEALMHREPWYKKVLENLSNNKFIWLIIFLVVVAILQIPWESILKFLN